MIPEEHWKKDEISVQNVYGDREPVNVRIRGMLFTYCVCDMHEKRKRYIIVPEKYGIRPYDRGHIKLRNLQV